MNTEKNSTNTSTSNLAIYKKDYTPRGFISGTKVGSTIDIAYYIKRIKNKNHILIILIDAEKVVKKTQHYFMI